MLRSRRRSPNCCQDHKGTVASTPTVRRVRLGSLGYRTLPAGSFRPGPHGQPEVLRRAQRLDAFANGSGSRPVWLPARTLYPFRSRDVECSAQRRDPDSGREPRRPGPRSRSDHHRIALGSDERQRESGSRCPSDAGGRDVDSAPPDAGREHVRGRAYLALWPEDTSHPGLGHRPQGPGIAWPGPSRRCTCTLSARARAT